MAITEERIPQIKQQQPKRKANRKLITLLTVFFLAVLIVVFIRSPYSKVTEIQVFGNDLYSKEAIVAASGITVGMQFLNVWEGHVQNSSKQLEGIKEITVTREFPGVIQLHVKEYKRVAVIMGADGKNTILLENGVQLKQDQLAVKIVDRPLVRSWTAPELLPQLAKSLAELSPSILSEISDIMLTPTTYDKQRVTMYMRDGNEVRSVVYLLGKKLTWYPSIVKELPKDERGVIFMLESTWFSKYGTEPQQAVDDAKGDKSTSETANANAGSGSGSADNAAQSGNKPPENHEEAGNQVPNGN